MQTASRLLSKLLTAQNAEKNQRGRRRKAATDQHGFSLFDLIRDDL
jgi:hypothetical protein